MVNRWLRGKEFSLSTFLVNPNHSKRDAIQLKIDALALEESASKISHTDNREHFGGNWGELKSTVRPIELDFFNVRLHDFSEQGKHVLRRAVLTCFHPITRLWN
jgi:hypothetical protein